MYERGNYRLNFFGRVTVPSVKNFQLVQDTKVTTAEGVDEKGFCTTSGRCLVEVDPRYFRPTEVELLIGDPSKAQEKLGWHHETSPRDLAREMVQADLKVMRDAPIGKGA